MTYVNQGIPKRDAMALITGRPVYTDDIAPKDCLIVKVLRSPHAFARITDIDTSAAKGMAGIACVLTHRDVPGNRFTMAGQSVPEPSPYDRLILEDLVRYVGDPVAIVAGTDDRTVDRALAAIRVSYETLTPVLDPEKALDHPSVIHPEDDYHVNFDIGNEKERNLCSSGSFEHGDADAEFSGCDTIVDRTYHVKANSQAMMETFRTYSYLDHADRLTIVSSTQVPFHVRHIAARALDIPKQRVRVIKPRIGGGFGAKQTLVSELFPALVTLKTGRPAKIVFLRTESFTASTSRHEMFVRVRAGADNTGRIRALHVDTLSNTGAYGEHAPTTVGLTAEKTLPLYNKANAFKFTYNVVYTNTMSAGAFRGYGATQGTFAMESAINELAHELGMDPLELREMNLLEQGEVLPAYHDERLNSCALDRCIRRGRELIGWDSVYPRVRLDETRVRAVGCAVTMQGSSIPDIDTAAVDIRLQDDGFYTLAIGATDMGTGCDTILAQMAADCLECDIDRITTTGVDTDHSPFDTGSYASATTYLTGMAVVKACKKIKTAIKAAAAEKLGQDPASLEFDGKRIFNDRAGISLDRLARELAVGTGNCLTATAAHSSPVSPPPFMAGFAEIELDLETGQIDMRNFVGVVDCGTPVNPNLARLQAEGGIVQGIGMTLTEDITYTTSGKMMNNSFMTYKIPSRLDTGNIRVAFESSFEPTGPFGAKSIGEVVINTPAPAIAHAVFNACGIRFTSLPITAEKVLAALRGEREKR